MSMLTDEQIQEVVTAAVRERRLSWLGFKRDDQGAYSVPVLSPSDFQFARAIEAAATEQLLQRIAELKRQLEEARKDAERYRWLVAQMMHPDADHQEEMFNRLHSINPDPANAKEVDAAIDAAMQKGQS